MASSPAPPRSKVTESKNATTAAAAAAAATTTTPPLVEAILSQDRLQNGTGGVVVNDPNGLCLVHKGNVLVQGNDHHTGVLTSLTRLAQQLHANHKNNNNNNHQHHHPPPLISLEYDTTAILLKDYDGHAVALQVPKNDITAATVQATTTSTTTEATTVDATTTAKT